MAADTLRLDPEYYLKVHLADAHLVQSRPEAFRAINDIPLTADASAFYPSIEDYYGTGDLPFLRVGDVDGLIDHGTCITIPAELCDRFPTLNKVVPGDILFTKGGAIDRVGLVSEVSAVSRDLISLSASALSPEHRLFLFSYFQTSFFKRALLRSSSQTAQPHLTLGLVRKLPSLVSSDQLNRSVAHLARMSIDAAQIAKNALAEAEHVLLDAMGLHDWSPPHPLHYIGSASSVFDAGRFDANYFAPKYDDVFAKLKATGAAKSLDDGLTRLVSRGSQPEYNNSGLPVINSKHVRTNRVLLSSGNRRAAQKKLLIQKGDVLVNGTGVGTIGRAAPYLEEQEAVPDNHVTIIRPMGISPLYLSVYLNSQVGQLQIERMISGSSGQIELYPADVRKIVIWDAPSETQLKIADAVQRSFAMENRATDLLTAAKRAVEIAIECSEAAALDFIAEQDATNA